MKQRTTVRLDSDLMRRAKEHALKSGTTLTAVIENSLREALARRRVAEPCEPIQFVTFRGDGVLPGVDLSDGRKLRDRMDGL